ncbi:MAG TPA: hypothetical protein DIW54_06885 [Chitinophagaceae bacterium]|nr:hypothetical protein [Chitinophagaceae bacterium]
MISLLTALTFLAALCWWPGVNHLKIPLKHYKLGITLQILLYVYCPISNESVAAYPGKTTATSPKVQYILWKLPQLVSIPFGFSFDQIASTIFASLK